MTEDQIKHMVDRFLGWKLPGDLEAIWTRDKPTLRPTPRPFVDVSTRKDPS